MKWEVKTNRHPTTSGYSWGWIEGSPNLCWSNDRLVQNEADAHRLVAKHNRGEDVTADVEAWKKAQK
jgi:hypothetical protein